MTKQHKTIITLGPKGTYSQKAVNQYDPDAKVKYCDDISGVFEAFLKEEVECIVVPAENSIEGSVTITLDLLAKYCLKIIGEEVVHIRHCFLFKGEKEDVKMIYTHPQARQQCRDYIARNFPGIKVYDAPSTASAAKKASRAKHIAAIASKEAAEEYGLKIFAEDIQDVNENYTRFIVIGKNTPAPTGKDKTSILVYLKKNRAGALYEILGDFARRDIDLSRIESRTVKKTLGEYMFHIDIKGNMDDPEIRDTLQGIREKAEILVVLGSYPEAKVE